MTQPQDYPGPSRLLSVAWLPFSRMIVLGQQEPGSRGLVHVSQQLPAVRTTATLKRCERLRSDRYLLPAGRNPFIRFDQFPPDALARYSDGLDQLGLARVGVGVDRLGRVCIATGLAGCTLLTQLRSISTATERCSRLTDSTSFNPDLILTMIPVMPRRGPSSIRATWPTCRYGQGIVEMPCFTTR
jgi:hypothetical protein